MNCEPGDLAVVVRNTFDHPCYEYLKGATLTVGQLHPGCHPLVPVWQVKGRGLRCVIHGDPIFNFADADLQPIRGPKPSDQVPTERPLLEEHS